MRVEHAKKLLALTEKNVTEIGLECGFSVTSYFIKIFHQFTHMTPKAYRNLIKSKQDDWRVHLKQVAKMMGIVLVFCVAHPFLVFGCAPQKPSVPAQKQPFRLFFLCVRFPVLYLRKNIEPRFWRGSIFWWRWGESNPCPKISWYSFLRVHSVF